MAKRERASIKKSNYFTSPKANIDFVSSGCTVLDCALGGGYPLGRMVNIVGDKSTAKTALATEALINFTTAYADGVAAYHETEAAYDRGYAEAMGLPLDKIDFGDKPLDTVEDFARDLDKFIDKQTKTDAPGIYVLDSLDALSDEAEMERDIGQGTYGTAKAKQLSAFFRTTTRKVERSKVLLFIVSQVRENIGVAFGERQKRAGGKSMDFYASQVPWLAHIKTLKKTIKGVERPYGVIIKAKIKKNKVALPLRECEFPFIFGYGVDDLTASVNWLKEVKRLSDVDLKEAELKDYLKEMEGAADGEFRTEQKRLATAVKAVWSEIEDTFLPTRRKYANSE